MKNYCYLNGRILPEEKATISINDIGFLRAYGVFDFIRTYNGTPFLLREHVERLKLSARRLNLMLPISETELVGIVCKLLKINNQEESTIRIVLTGGVTPDGITYKSTNSTLLILVRKLAPVPRCLYENGVKLITNEYQRDIPRAKTLNYINFIRLQETYRQSGAFNVLYVCKKRILEAAISNFFIVEGQKLVTPSDNVLIGVTRNFVLRLAKHDFEIEERDISLSELTDTDEAFITGTTQGIVPVVQVDSIKIGNGKVGQATSYLIKLFEKTICQRKY